MSRTRVARWLALTGGSQPEPIARTTSAAATAWMPG